MSPLAPSQQKRIPLMVVGAVAALGFAIWNVQRALQPPLKTIRPIGTLDRVSGEVQRSLPYPSGEESVPSGTSESVAPNTGERVEPGVKPPGVAEVSEENLAPAANPFVPLPGQGQFGEQFITAATPQYEAMPTLPSPTYIPERVTPMRLATATLSINPRNPRRKPNQAASRPVVSIRSDEPSLVGPQAPVLPAVAPAPVPHPAPAPPAQPEPPPALVGTLLGDQPSAVFQLNGNIIIVPAGGMLAGWQLLTVEHGQAMLKHIATGTKIPVLVAAESTPGVK